MLTILMGRAKTGKSDAVLGRIRELGDVSSQILLVPEHASHQAEVDLCRFCGNTASRHAEVLSFRRLGDRVLGITGGLAQVTLDAGGKLLTLQKAMGEVAPMLRVYRRPSRKAAFLQQMLDLLDELRCYEVTPQVLEEQSRAIPGATGEKLRDLSLLYAAYEARLLRPGFDARDRMSKLCDHLEESGYVRDKDIFLDGFTYFNAQERRVLEVMLRQARSVTVTLLADPARQEREIFRAGLRTREQLVRLARGAGCPWEETVLRSQDPTALGHVERCFFGETIPFDGDFSNLRVREAESLYDEVEQTAADILHLVASGVCRFRDITVAARNMADYEGTIETVFQRYGIPAYLSRRSDILEKPVWSLVTGVLSAIETGFEYEEMFRWLKTGLAGLTADECDLLENYVLKWEIHGQMWLRDVDWTGNPDGYGAPMDQRRQERLDQVNAIRRRVREPLAELCDGLRKAETAGGKVDALYSFLERLDLQNVLEGQMRAQAEAGRLQEAEETAQLWEILCGILDQFVEILGDEPMEQEEFSRLLRQVASQYSVGTIPVSLDQVSVSEITRNDRHTVGYLFLLGANDHVLPAVGQSGGILNEDDREELAIRGIALAPTGMDQLAIELQLIYAALAQPTRGLTVSYPVCDISGSELRPAFVVDRLRELFPGLQIQRAPDKEYRLTAVTPALEAAGQDPGGALWAYFAARPEFAGRLTAMEQAASLRRGALSPAAVRALYGQRVSLTASRLERVRSCHFAYFMEYGLRAKPRTAAAFDAPQIGTFLHYLLENVTRDVLARGGFAQVGEEDLHALVRLYIQRYVEQELHNFQDRGARFRYLFDRLRNTAYAVVDQAAVELRCSDFVPLAFELSFGDGKELPAVVISEPDGELRVGGKVDRVDGWVKDGKLYLRVVDYKSGKKAFDLASVRMGLDIQMLLYLFALQKEGPQRFQMPVEPAGVLYFPARDEILPAERNIPPEKLQREVERQLRRTGLLLADPAVLQAMEHSALEEPRYLPLRVGRDGSVSGSIASAAQLGRLGLYVDKLLRQIAGEVRRGNIDADPCCRSEDESACRYCDWADACHFQDGRDTDRLRYILPVRPEEFWDAVDRETQGEEGHPWQN